MAPPTQDAPSSLASSKPGRRGSKANRWRPTRSSMPEITSLRPSIIAAVECAAESRSTRPSRWSGPFGMVAQCGWPCSPLVRKPLKPWGCRSRIPAHERGPGPPTPGAQLRLGYWRAVRRPLGTGALAVVASRPAAGATLAFLELLLCPANAALPRRLLLGILDPADELVAGQGRDVLPCVERRCVG